MNAPAPAALFSSVEMAPRDPILGITEAYVADKNPSKVNLGVGVYYDDNGKVPLLKCVQEAEAKMLEQQLPRNYVPIDGLAVYDKAVQELVFGADNPVIQEKRALTVQALGGTGALKLGADFIKRLRPNAAVWISNPSWENHRALFESAGFTVKTYRYYKPETRGVDFEGMIADLQTAPAGDVILLHACCHNPTGADLSQEQWGEVIKVLQAKNLVPFLDMAYQGFGDGIAEDGAVVRRFTEAGGPLFVSNSFSKSISLYGERIGALSIVAADSAEAARVLSQMKRVVRTNYSSPPMHVGQVVAMTLTNADLRKLWEDELAVMRGRIKDMRKLLVEKLKQKAPSHNFDFVIKQRGMFSYSGLTKDQVERLRAEYSIYAIDTGRICIAALNTKNIDYVTDAIAKVL